MQYQLILMPIIGALIGWGTNLLAIKLIFRPHSPVKIPLTGITFQGLIPKRRKEIARSIGEALEKDVISVQEIMDSLLNDKTKGLLMKHIRDVIVEKASEKLSFIPQVFKNSILEHLGVMVDQHGGEIFDELKDGLNEKAKDELDLTGLVENKINSFDIGHLESLIISLSKNELRQIEVIGGVLGFFIGTFQALFAYFLL